MTRKVRRIAIAAVGRTPPAVRSWVYRHPAIWNPLARLVRGLVPDGETSVVDVRVGPNAGLKLAIERGTPNYYWLQDDYEHAVVAVLRGWLRPGVVVADVGAHIGFLSMFMARQVGPEGEVIGIEPSPIAAAQFRRNVEINELRNVRVIEAAVSDAAGEARFLLLAHPTTSHLAERGPEQPGQGVTVPLVRLDDLIFGDGGPGRLDVAKLDVEGHEAAVLRGAVRVLHESRPKLLIEVHTPAALADCLRQLGHASYTVVTTRPDRYYERVLADVEAAERDATQFSINHLVCTPG